MIESRTTRSFRTAFATLPAEIQIQARRTYSLFRTDPAHPSLRFKKVAQAENSIPFALDSVIAPWAYSKVQWSHGSGSVHTPIMTGCFESKPLLAGDGHAINADGRTGQRAAEFEIVGNGGDVAEHLL